MEKVSRYQQQIRLRFPAIVDDPAKCSEDLLFALTRPREALVGLSTEMSVAETQSFRMMSTGVYLVQVGDGTAQRVVVR